jgi:tetratricopeptide (TPR) repeat protein
MATRSASEAAFVVAALLNAGDVDGAAAALRHANGASGLDLYRGLVAARHGAWAESAAALVAAVAGGTGEFAAALLAEVLAAATTDRLRVDDWPGALAQLRVAEQAGVRHPLLDGVRTRMATALPLAMLIGGERAGAIERWQAASRDAVPDQALHGLFLAHLHWAESLVAAADTSAALETAWTGAIAAGVALAHRAEFWRDLVARRLDETGMNAETDLAEALARWVVKDVLVGRLHALAGDPEQAATAERWNALARAAERERLVAEAVAALAPEPRFPVGGPALAALLGSEAAHWLVGLVQGPAAKRPLTVPLARASLIETDGELLRVLLSPLADGFLAWLEGRPDEAYRSVRATADAPDAHRIEVAGVPIPAPGPATVARVVINAAVDAARARGVSTAPPVAADRTAIERWVDGITEGLAMLEEALAHVGPGGPGCEAVVRDEMEKLAVGAANQLEVSHRGRSDTEAVALIELGITLLELALKSGVGGRIPATLAELEKICGYLRLPARDGSGEAKKRVKAYDAAVPHFARAVELVPDNQDYRRELGIAYHNRGCEQQRLKRFDAAIADFSRTIKAWDDNSLHVAALTARANCYAGKDDFDHALEDLLAANKIPCDGEQYRQVVQGIMIVANVRGVKRGNEVVARLKYHTASWADAEGLMAAMQDYQLAIQAAEQIKEDAAQYRENLNIVRSMLEQVKKVLGIF